MDFIVFLSGFFGLILTLICIVLLLAPWIGAIVKGYFNWCEKIINRW